jgi:peptide-methionine (S)-S-oxide reductase
MGALSGVVRTRVGYSGGTVAEPTYRRVCGSPEWGDWVETVQLEYDPSALTYAEVLDAFFRNHDGWRGQRPSRARQYQSVIFAHDEAQLITARQAVGARPGCGTKVEPFSQFWDAEAYHQKWLLQRKPRLFLSLGLREPSELVSSRAAVQLNALAAGRLRPETAARRLKAFVGEDGFGPEQQSAAIEAMAEYTDEPIVMYG